MQNNYKSSRSKLSFFTRRNLLRGLAILIAVSLLLVVLEKTRLTNFIKLDKPAAPPAQPVGPTPEQQKQETDANAQTKQLLLEDTTMPTNNTKADETDTTPSSTTAIELSARQEPNNTVTVFTKLLGISDGNCDLTVTSGSRTTTQNVRVIYQREFSSCAGFSIPIDSIGKGKWTIDLILTSGKISKSKTISYEVK